MRPPRAVAASALGDRQGAGHRVTAMERRDEEIPFIPGERPPQSQPSSSSPHTQIPSPPLRQGSWAPKPRTAPCTPATSRRREGATAARLAIPDSPSAPSPDAPAKPSLPRSSMVPSIHLRYLCIPLSVHREPKRKPRRAPPPLPLQPDPTKGSCGGGHSGCRDAYQSRPGRSQAGAATSSRESSQAKEARLAVFSRER